MVKAVAIPAQEYLNECFTYSPLTGELFWKERPAYHFNSAHRQKITNNKYAGKIAGGAKLFKDGQSYVIVGVLSRRYLAHRIIWGILHGNDLPEQIDHIDGNGLNNAETNLAASCNKANGKNQKLHKNNKSGVTGVNWSDPHKKWKVMIVCNSERIYLGLFSDFREAVSVRRKAERDLGFHPNHGKPR